MKKIMMIKKIMLFINIPILCFLLVSCAAGAAGNDEYVGADLSDEDIAMISEDMGLDLSEAAELYSLLTETGMSGGIKYITVWNDAEN